MAQKLKVRTPVTTDGINLAYDSKRQPIYTESIVEVAAKPIFETLNAGLPEHLRHELTVISEKEPKKVDASAEKLKAKDAEIAELKKQLEAAAKAAEEAAAKAAEEAAAKAAEEAAAKQAAKAEAVKPAKNKP